MTEEASQIAEERREVKSKGERERANQLDTQFQRIARRGKRPSSMNNVQKAEIKTIPKKKKSKKVV